MRLKLLAFDSMGTRSMSTLIETRSARILIDPGAALGPRRYGLRPHRVEYERLREHKERIVEEAREADIIIITHYHYDHFPTPSEKIEWLRGKRILLKDPSRMINFSQRRRSSIFLKQLKEVDARPVSADSKEFKIEGCRIELSSPVKHGNDERLGYVLEVLIECGGERILFTSDVEGIVDRSQLKFILDNEPETLICDGPMTYMLGNRFSEEDLSSSIKNLLKILEKKSLREIILDHHLVRDLEWRSKLKVLLEKAEDLGVRLETAASYMGVDEEPLEAMRRQLYEKGVDT